MLEPIYEYHLIEAPEKVTEKTLESGIVIPIEVAEQEEPYPKGKVVKVGDGPLLSTGEIRPPRVKEGDIVLYNKGTAIHLKDGDKEYLLVQERNMIAIWRNDEEANVTVDASKIK